MKYIGRRVDCTFCGISIQVRNILISSSLPALLFDIL